MSLEKVDDDIQIIFEDKVDYSHFQSDIMKEFDKMKQCKLEEDGIQILIEKYNDSKFRLDIAKEHNEILNMPKHGSLTYYINLLISLSKISYKQWLYSQKNL